jgi:hypothetical protein
MAGGWGHMTNDDGTPYDSTFGNGSMLENGGDVTEALQQCYGMIWWLADTVADAAGRPDNRAPALAWIRRAQAGHRDGIRLGQGPG